MSLDDNKLTAELLNLAEENRLSQVEKLDGKMKYKYNHLYFSLKWLELISMSLKQTLDYLASFDSKEAENDFYEIENIQRKVDFRIRKIRDQKV